MKMSSIPNSTLVPLMKMELRREIEMEFRNTADIFEPVTVQVVYQNYEKRGHGKRLIFHCQGINSNIL